MVHYLVMPASTPVTTPGPALRKFRRDHGVLAGDVAVELQHHRNTIRRWENEPEVDLRRSRLYRAAVRRLAGTL
jgi:hypothetical protein